LEATNPVEDWKERHYELAQSGTPEVPTEGAEEE